MSCGNQPAEYPIHARRGPTFEVCESCHSDAMSSDGGFWAWYWHDSQAQYPDLWDEWEYGD
jgi:hypothetical protein